MAVDANTKGTVHVSFRAQRVCASGTEIGAALAFLSWMIHAPSRLGSMLGKPSIKVRQPPPFIWVLIDIGPDFFVAEQGLETPSVQIFDLLRVDEPLCDEDMESFQTSHQPLNFEFVPLHRTIPQSVDRFVEFAKRFIDLQQELRCRGFACQFQLLARVQQSAGRDEHGDNRRHIGNDG